MTPRGRSGRSSKPGFFTEFFKDLFATPKPCEVCRLGKKDFRGDKAAVVEWNIWGNNLDICLLICIGCSSNIEYLGLTHKNPAVVMAALIANEYVTRPPVEAYLEHPGWRAVWKSLLDFSTRSRAVTVARELVQMQEQLVQEAAGIDFEKLRGDTVSGVVAVSVAAVVKGLQARDFEELGLGWADDSTRQRFWALDQIFRILLVTKVIVQRHFSTWGHEFDERFSWAWEMTGLEEVANAVAELDALADPADVERSLRQMSVTAADEFGNDKCPPDFKDRVYESVKKVYLDVLQKSGLELDS